MITSNGEELTEEQWKDRYIVYIMKHSDALLWQAEESAEVAWDYILENDGDESPEEDAQNELDNWE